MSRIKSKKMTLTISMGMAILIYFTSSVSPLSAYAKDTDNRNAPKNCSNSEGGTFISHCAAEITSQVDRNVRAQMATQLEQWVKKHSSLVQGSDITRLADLLKEDDDVVRRSAAGALGFLGERSASAVPQLVQALRERPCSNQPATSADTIRSALKSIGSPYENIPCTDPFGS